MQQAGRVLAKSGAADQCADAMATDAVQQLQAYLQPLLGSLDGLIQLTRHLDPIGYSHQLARAGEAHRDLRVVRGTPEWAPPYSALRPVLDETADLVIAAYDGLIEASAPPEDMMLAFKALRHLPRALETLYPLAGIVPPINRFYLDPGAREDMELQKRLFRQPPPERTGAIRIGEDASSRETFWMYAPETYEPGTRRLWCLRCTEVPGMGGPSCGAGCARREHVAPLLWHRRRRDRHGPYRVMILTRHDWGSCWPLCARHGRSTLSACC